MSEQAPQPQPEVEQQTQINWEEAFDAERPIRQAAELEAARQEELRLQAAQREEVQRAKDEKAYFEARQAGNDEAARYEESMPASNEELSATDLLFKFGEAEVNGDRTVMADTEELLKEKIEAGEFDGEKFSTLAQVAGYAEVRGNDKSAEFIQKIVDKKITDEYNQANYDEDYRVRDSRAAAPTERTGVDDKSLARAKKYERYNKLKQKYADELRGKPANADILKDLNESVSEPPEYDPTKRPASPDREPRSKRPNNGESQNDNDWLSPSQPSSRPTQDTAVANDPETAATDQLEPEQLDHKTAAEKFEELQEAISLFNFMADKAGPAFAPGPEYYSRMKELSKAISMTQKGAIGYNAFGQKLNSAEARKFLDGLNPRKWIMSESDTDDAKMIIDYNDRSIARGSNAVPHIGDRSKRSQLLDIREFNDITNSNGPIHYQVVSNYRDYVDNRLNLSEELKRLNPNYQPQEADRHDVHTYVQQNRANLLNATRKAGRARRLNLRGRAAGVKTKLSNGANRALDSLDDAHNWGREKISRKIEDNDRKVMVDVLTSTPVEEMKAKATEIKARDAIEMKGTWTQGRASATTRHKQFRDQVNNIVYKAEQKNR